MVQVPTGFIQTPPTQYDEKNFEHFQCELIMFVYNTFRLASDTTFSTFQVRWTVHHYFSGLNHCWWFIRRVGVYGWINWFSVNILLFLCYFLHAMIFKTWLTFECSKIIIIYYTVCYTFLPLLCMRLISESFGLPIELANNKFANCRAVLPICDVVFLL